MEDVSKEEIDNIIKDLHNKGYTSSYIGKYIKDQKGVNFKELYKTKITRYMKSINIKYDIPEDLLFLLKRISKILKHLESNKQDKVTKKSLEEIETQVLSLIKYYKKRNKLPKSFEYSRDLAKMYASS
ncbi:30S ribosomal protein S15 [Nanobdella aerobiophila]|uniref:30S ribosomal protein S15 n=1 Tax=Nanobdella aerobiophila TaxID=2586965 RepID=A0A915WRR1_9ARCH|nr:30S ribosomal protein S15 [Nanobdella aerobiophila]BBL45489.1 30S ribosomal protein S15 [Nanobdella aerobiophila]